MGGDNDCSSTVLFYFGSNFWLGTNPVVGRIPLVPAETTLVWLVKSTNYEPPTISGTCCIVSSRKSVRAPVRGLWTFFKVCVILCNKQCETPVWWGDLTGGFRGGVRGKATVVLAFLKRARTFAPFWLFSAVFPKIFVTSILVVLASFLYFLLSWFNNLII